MRPRTLVAALAVVAVASVCVRLGFWQISRWHEKQALNGTMRHALEEPAIPLAGQLPPLDSLLHRRVEVRGTFDLAHQVLLSARSNAGAPGVHVVTPLRLSDRPLAILVDRGWLYSPDAATARPQDFPELGELTIVGVAEPARRGAGGAALRAIPADSARVYSARWIDLDSLRTRIPYALAPFTLRQLPGSGVPENPRRLAPLPFDESMHVSYAVQWFLFAAILIGGSLALAQSRRTLARREAGTSS